MNKVKQSIANKRFNLTQQSIQGINRANKMKPLKDIPIDERWKLGTPPGYGPEEKRL